MLKSLLFISVPVALLLSAQAASAAPLLGCQPWAGVDNTGYGVELTNESNSPIGAHAPVLVRLRGANPRLLSKDVHVSLPFPLPAHGRGVVSMAEAQRYRSCTAQILFHPTEWTKH